MVLGKHLTFLRDELPVLRPTHIPTIFVLDDSSKFSHRLVALPVN
ncbi:hypothetical protein AG0111_0g8000 [Alternaria gaisen]|uniref:Uncharacterized protein n=1 Tax=Alternaria gaisen TaxID=167740 RepID=A0ACB6FGM5_9PLEO|nr:hypothetical protein AG0111_0g8000 [Alternaria gaisen]